ncbi:MAG TPA: PAS domain S-box protein [Burkholderiales bacterium]|nr:PAS domain S-box protein [Burkholderiales bacterium]
MIEERFAAARVAALFGVARSAYATTIAAGGVLLAILWGAIAAERLSAWFAVLLLLTAARVVLHLRYRRDPAAVRPRTWELRFAAGAGAAGVLWCLPVLAFFPAADPLLQMAVIFVIGGSVIGAAGVYAASPIAFYGFCVPPILGAAVQLALQPGHTYQLLALLALVFGLAMIRVYRDLHANIVGALRVRSENEELLARLARSEAQLRDAIESFPEGIAVYDAEDRLVVCNEVYARVYGAGKSAGDLAGAPYAAIAQNALAAEVLPREYEGRGEQWIEERLARRRSGGGAVRHYETRDGRALQGLFVRSRAGGIVSMFTDVTELRRAQDAYGQVVAEETLVLDTLPVGVAFFADRILVRCNRRLEQMLGYAPGELNGKPARILHPTDEAWLSAGGGYEALRGGAVLDSRLELARKDGGRLWCSLLIRALDAQSPRKSAIVAFSDIGERYAAEQALRKSEAMYRNLVETSNDLIWSVDTAGRWTYLSPAAVRRIYGCPPEELLGREFSEVLAQEVGERDLAVFRRILAGESVFDYETRHLRRDGSHVDLSFNAVPLRDAQGAVIGATGTARDITTEKAAAAALYENVEKLRLAVDAAELMYWEWDRETDQLHWGRDPSALVGESGGRSTRWSEYLEIVHPEDRDRYLATVSAAWEQAGVCTNEYRVIRQDGRVSWLSSHGKTLADASGKVYRMIGVSQDITERKRQEEEARFLAYHDTLTGLPNRRLLDDRLRQAVFLAQRRDARVALMVVDLDRFKQVNDALGHRAGDAVLREAAHRIAGCLRKADTLARHGGDEFVVVIPDLQLDTDCQVVAEKILRSLEPPFRVDGRDFSIGASIGVSLYPTDAGDGEALLRNADVAMYRAKQLGRNNYRFYGR